MSISTSIRKTAVAVFALSSAFAFSQKQIVKEVVVNANPKQAYEKWTTSAGLKTFFGQDNKITLQPGGEFEIYFDAKAPVGKKGSEGCKVLSFLPNKMFSFSWNAPPKFPEVRNDKQKTVVVVEFKELNSNQTKVILTHHNWKSGGQWDSVYKYFDNAWWNVMQYYTKAFNATVERPELFQYLYKIQLTPRLHDDNAWTAEDRDIINKHFQYLQAALKEDKLILAGRTDEDGDKTFGIVIYKAPFDDEAKKFMENDPAVKAGIMIATFHKYQIALKAD